MFRSPPAAINHAQPTKHLLSVPIIQAFQIGIEIEGDECIFLLSRGVVLWTALDDFHGGDVDSCGGRGRIQQDAKRGEETDDEGYCCEESKDILDTD